jgi:hypothetical protein
MVPSRADADVAPGRNRLRRTTAFMRDIGDEVTTDRRCKPTAPPKSVQEAHEGLMTTAKTQPYRYSIKGL